MTRLTPPQQNAIRLAALALVCLSVLGIMQHLTEQPIAAARQRRLEQQLQQVMPADHYDNDLLSDVLLVSDRRLGTLDPQPVWRARRDGQPTGVVLSVIAPTGYSGPIELLLGVDISGRILGARVLVHRETPGLGDDIDLLRSDWILGFNGHSLRSRDEAEWRVKPDGGAFDALTGATITPRAIVAAIYRALGYFEKNREMLFNETR